MSTSATLKADTGDVQSLIVDISGGWVKSGFAGNYAPLSDIRLSRSVADFAKTFAIIAKKELRIVPEQHPILIITSVNYLTNENKSRLSNVFFNGFKVPLVFFAYAGQLALYATGSREGVVIYIEEDLLEVTAYHEGTLIDESVRQGEYSGKNAVADGHELHLINNICETVKKTMNACKRDLLAKLLSHIVLTGRLDINNPLPADFYKAVEEKLTLQLGESVSVIIKQPYETSYQSWVGGSILASMDTFKKMWVSNVKSRGVNKAMFIMKKF
ncbi:hypothetical protein AAF463_24165 (plasmid) [Pantoea sp. BJ2]|uniref:Actin-like protein N-terminal domain-containing protein n=1 Tax=Pantoea sp. BJ2 TaxID=3141322 RepID=A0AAU7U400_9GAMM